MFKPKPLPTAPKAKITGTPTQAKKMDMLRQEAVRIAAAKKK